MIQDIVHRWQRILRMQGWQVHIHWLAGKLPYRGSILQSLTRDVIAEIELVPNSPLWNPRTDPEAVIVHELLEAKLTQGREGPIGQLEEAGVSQLARALYFFHRKRG